MTDTIDDPFLADLAPEPADGSLLERLRAQRAAASKKEHYLDLVLPSWGADTGGVQIIARLKRINCTGATQAAVTKINRALLMGAAVDLDTACDLLIAGIDQLYAREPDGKLVPLGDDEPLKFDERTAQALGLPAKRAREVVTEIFGGAQGGFELAAAAQTYATFLQSGLRVSEEEGKA